jgi:hypothetical protein
MLRERAPWNGESPELAGLRLGAGATGLEPATSGVTETAVSGDLALESQIRLRLGAVFGVG